MAEAALLTMTGQPDIYGQVHPVETPELIQTKLTEFDVQVQNIPAKKKVGLAMAEERCPEQLTSDFKLMFLRCEVYKVQRAAKRYIQFWETKREICGDERAFKPTTLQEAYRQVDDVTAFNMGFCRLLGGKDPSGRHVIFVDSSRQDKALCARAVARAAAYVLLTALEDETTQQKGIVVLVYPAKARVGQFNREFVTIMGKALQGAMPVRLSGVHICQPPIFFRIIFPFVQMIMGSRLSQRIRVNFGSTESVQKELARYGLTKDILPTELGGDVVLDHESWLQDRMRLGK